MFLFTRKPTQKKHAIYLDNASATPVDPTILEFFSSIQKNVFANPGSIHGFGISAKNVIQIARKKIASLLSVKENEILFTSSGTESNNLAIHGVVQRFLKDSPRVIPHVITSAIEHASVLEPLRELANDGAIELSIVPVNQDGIIEVPSVRELLKENTLLVSIIHANNEIGTIQPIREIGKVIEKYRVEHARHTPYFHIDACQSFNYLEIKPHGLRVDMCTFNSSKIYSPRGAGVLYVAERVPLQGIMQGGDQESGLRPGTENTAAIAACAEAFEKALSIREEESVRLREIQDYAFSQLKNAIPTLKIWGTEKEEFRVPNNINVSVPGIFSEEFVVSLDMAGVYISSKSACGMSNDDGSYVIKALQGTDAESKEAIRISMGRSTQISDIDVLIEELKKVIARKSKVLQYK